MAELYMLKGHTINTFTYQWIIFGHVISGLANEQPSNSSYCCDRTVAN